MKNIKNDSAYKTIGEVAKKLKLVDKKTGSIQTHTIRYWEKQFKQIKPLVKAGRRRYYSIKDLKVLNYIKFLLKDKGLTINGVKKILDNKDVASIDHPVNLGVYNAEVKRTKIVKDKIKKIQKIIKELKNIKNG